MIEVLTIKFRRMRFSKQKHIAISQVKNEVTMIRTETMEIVKRGWILDASFFPYGTWDSPVGKPRGKDS